ncbi:recombinase family protein [Glaciimonas soli]|uniref:Recombinase family protein n=1 Tax=Glaciimonas soli TaxID=2590999 RepID=A0A843YUI7_9BURK|nr:recombinase family protein [Glaciimonas soli]MQR01657.1 recombinase family protein [Glaciimonas soli]
MKATIYARYSTDKQSEASIEDQVRVCQVRAEKEGITVVSTYTDFAISGSTAVSSRTGGNALLADALAGRFQILLLEGLDRLSRDQVEQERIVRRLEHRGIRIICVADGYDSKHSARKIMRGVRGLINELYLDDLRHKTHRGQSGQVDRGFVAGGKSYGYDLIKTEEGSKYQINEAQAKWIRWIFEHYASGDGIHRMAHELNRLGVPSARGGTWCVSALYGSPVKGSGILNNSLYIGKYVWNRSQWIKDPDTGKRQRTERPEDEWQHGDNPELRIIDDQLWGEVRLRIDYGRNKSGRKQERRPSSTLFGGLLLCPHCGATVIAINATRYGCNAAMNRGSAVCSGFSISRETVEKRLLSVVRDDLLSPAAAAEFEQTFNRVLEEKLSSYKDDLKISQNRLAQLNDEVTRMVDAIATIGISAALANRLKLVEAERDTIQRTIETYADNKKAVTPDISSLFKSILANLSSALQDNKPAAHTILRNIFGKMQIELQGNEVWAQTKTDQLLKLVSDPSTSTTVVAGAGFEPTTFGL